MTDRERQRYDILRALVVAGADDRQLEEAGRQSLEQTAALIGLDAAALYLWDEKGKVVLKADYAVAEKEAKALVEIEEQLFAALRRDQAMVSAHMSFAGEPPLHSFTFPLRHGKDIFGAVIGLQRGERTAVAEDMFLDALAATLALNAIAAGQTSSLPRDLIDKERLAAISETAVTVNHEINNPLTAILGNVQLLLMHREDLDEDLRRKLSVIEESASKIREFTQKLLRLTSARSTEYTSGTNMLDISDEPDSSDDDNSR